jgi:NADP-dependent aldehyde dehydrogenase|tara:strand:- start:313 stop:1824 length:1512 start_codon:yes stop_codon:yes gene_type:complete
MVIGKHLIDGRWVKTDETFASSPYSGSSFTFYKGTPELVAQAAQAAELAFESFSQSSEEVRAELLNRIADEIDARGDQITLIGSQETGLPEARLIGERGRTTGQLRLFAEHILKRKYLDVVVDEAMPDRQPLARSQLQLMQRPLGPIAVFGASNFPLAFSTAGGDTAAALAAGCPVIVKGHSAHPGTGELVAQAIEAAIKALDLPSGIFSLIQGGDRKVGEALVQNVFIKAVGFTGSLVGGRALFNLCAARPEPIPFFGELGSVNPMFILPNALAHRGSGIGAGWATSLIMGAGQFCTNPGITVLIEGDGYEEFVHGVMKGLHHIPEQAMLTDGIAQAYRDGIIRIKKVENVEQLIGLKCGLRTAVPYLFSVDADTWLQQDELLEEVFGPLGIIVRAKDEEQLNKIVRSLTGQLTCTLHIDEQDYLLAGKLLPILERKAGRLLVNGFPTGVEVCDAMVHGGPYPASTNFGATSVGTLSIRRFTRPVCYQNIPKELLPLNLRRK